MLDLLMNGLQFLAKQGDLSICGDSMKGIWRLIGTLIFWIQIAIPVIIILLGTIDLAKAVLSGDEKKIKENLNSFIRRLIYGAAVFFIVFIVQLVFGAIADANTNNACFSCISDRGNC